MHTNLTYLQAIESFKKHLKVEKGYSPLTIKEYAGDLMLFYNFLRENFKFNKNFDLEDISKFEVSEFLADIILVNSNPKDIASLVVFGKATYRKMIQNFIWATGYNVVAIPLAAGVLFSAGIIISPALGAVLMSLSTIIVAINAQLLKKKMG